MTKQAEIIFYITDGRVTPLSNALLRRLDASPRFALFVEIYRDKIRKKIRTIRQPAGYKDLLAELEVADALLSDRRFAIAYEPYASAKRRGPDFRVTYRDNFVFNLEVAHIRQSDKDRSVDALAHFVERILRILLDKLGQMQPGMPNMLVIFAPDELTRHIELNGLMQAVKISIDKKEPVVFALSSYTSPAEFYKEFLHLSGIVLRGGELQAWANKQAHMPLPDKVLRLVASLLESIPKNEN